MVSLAGGWLSMIPNSAQTLAGHVISRLPFTPFNMVCTNVPGPQYPLYMLGRKLLHCYPYVPVGGEMALNCAILTYNGTAYFGFSGDVHAVPDLQRLESFLKLSFAELHKAIGAHSPHKENKKKKNRVSPKAKVNRETKVTTAPSAPVLDRASAPSRPAVSSELALRTVPPVMEEKALRRLIV